MIYPIYVIGHPVLRRKTELVVKNSPEIQKFIDDMFETMAESDGVGLAAPQVGKSLRIFVVDTTPVAKDNVELMNFKRVFINPQIVEKSTETVLWEEGCLSIPGIHENVKRYTRLTMEYYDRDFNFVREELDGFKAIVVQHEYDHLDGVLFTDKISPIRKKFLKNKILNISKGKVSTFYKIVTP
ncbi:MAG: peptide deformylase [Bacteroidales bacterium]|nr:peptide deformylase [Bacteroidales bacterium]HOY37897.1 peptide deformylase [Bacteroidales bacterium]HQP03854.1 peptide deformylase [Bacteroidales bacterium]